LGKKERMKELKRFMKRIKNETILSEKWEKKISFFCFSLSKKIASEKEFLLWGSLKNRKKKFIAQLAILSHQVKV
jgi:hypothetical protein